LSGGDPTDSQIGRKKKKNSSLGVQRGGKARASQTFDSPGGKKEAGVLQRKPDIGTAGRLSAGGQDLCPGIVAGISPTYWDFRKVQRGSTVGKDMVILLGEKGGHPAFPALACGDTGPGEAGRRAGQPGVGTGGDRVRVASAKSFI